MKTLIRSIALALLLAVPVHADLTVVDQTPAARMVATGGETVFRYTWGIYADTDLAVYRQADGVGSFALLQKGVDYTVSGMGGSDGGNVTLSEEAGAGDVIEIVPAFDFETSYTYHGGDLHPAQLNQSLNELVQLAQENRFSFDRRTLHFGVTHDPAESGSLPELAGNTGKVLGVAAGARSVSWIDQDCSGSICDPTTTETVWKIETNGAVCNGEDDTAEAIRTTLTNACAAGGGVIAFPPSSAEHPHVCLVTQTNSNVPVIEIPCGNLHFRGSGSTIKAATTDDPDNLFQVHYTAAVFRATNVDNISFEGFTFDGSRPGEGQAGTDPRLAFIRAEGVNDLVLHDNTFNDVSNTYGAINADSYACVANTVAAGETATSCTSESVDRCTSGLDIEHNSWNRSTRLFSMSGAQQSLAARYNKARLGDLSAETTPEAGYNYVEPTGGESGGDLVGATLTPRGISVVGFARVAQCDIHSLDISYNDVEGSVGIEAWNNDANTSNNDVGFGVQQFWCANGTTSCTQDSDCSAIAQCTGNGDCACLGRAFGITITNNNLHTMWGISANGWQAPVITGNNWRRLSLPHAEMLRYAADGGHVHGMYSTSCGLSDQCTATGCGTGTTCPAVSVFGPGIEAQPLTGGVVADNDIDCMYTQARPEGSCTGIVTGTVWDMTPNNLIASNRIRRCYKAINSGQSQDLAILGNYISDSLYGWYANPGVSTNNNQAADGTGNVFAWNTITYPQDGALSSAGSAIYFEAVPDANTTGDGTETWTITHNTIKRPNAGTAMPSAMFLDKYLTLRFAHNVWDGFKTYAIQDAALSSTYDFEKFDSLATWASPAANTVEPYLFQMQPNKVVRIGQTSTHNCGSFVRYLHATETCTAGHCSQTTATSCSTNTDCNASSNPQSAQGSNYTLGTWITDGTENTTPVAVAVGGYAVTIPAVPLRLDSPAAMRRYVGATPLWGTVASYDPASIDDSASVIKTFSCPGAALGDFISVAPTVDITGLSFSAYASNADNCAIVLQNDVGGTVDLSALGFNYTVRKP